MKLHKTNYATIGAINYYRELLNENCEYSAIRNNLMTDFSPNIDSELADSLLRGTHIIKHVTCNEVKFIKNPETPTYDFFKYLDIGYNKHISHNNKTYKSYGIVNSLGEYDIHLKNKYESLSHTVLNIDAAYDYFLYYYNKISSFKNHFQDVESKNLNNKCNRALYYADKNGDTVIPVTVNIDGDYVDVFLLCVEVKVPTYVKITNQPLDVYDSFIKDIHNELDIMIACPPKVRGYNNHYKFCA
jgi:hypothetical protein